MLLEVYNEIKSVKERKERKCTCSCKRGNWIFERQSNDYDADFWLFRLYRSQRIGLKLFIWQCCFPVELQGRVYACRNTLQFFTIPIGLFLGGFMVDNVCEGCISLFKAENDLCPNIKRLWNHRNSLTKELHLVQ